MILKSLFWFLTAVAASLCSADRLREEWVNAVQMFEHVFLPQKVAFTGVLDSIVADTSNSISTECRSSLHDYSSGLGSGNLTQMLMFDSISRPSGMISNQGYNLGSYQQCLSRGRYVLLGIQFPLPENKSITKLHQLDGQQDWRIFWSENIGFFREHPFYAGICVPSECGSHDLEHLFNSSLIQRLLHPLSLAILSTDSYSDENGLTIGQMISFSTIAALILVTVWSTVTNALLPHTAFARILPEFDAIRNTRKLVGVRKNRESITAALDIFRTNCVFSGFFVHVLYGMSGSITFRSSVFASSHNPFLTQFSKIIPINLGTICMIASCRSSYVWLNVMAEKRVRITEFLMIRILRSIPVITASILIVGTYPLVPFIGPFGKVIQEYTSNNCYHNGWKELFFVSNFSPINDMCNIVNWHVSVDLQLYAASFFILLILSRNEKLGLKLLFVAIVAGTIASGSYLTSNNLKIHLNCKINQVHNTLSNLNRVMFHTIHYVPVYGIGMLLGYVLWKQEGKKKPIGFAGCTVAGIILPTAFVLLNCKIYDDDFIFQLSPVAETIYSYTARIISSLLCFQMFYAFMNATHPLIVAISNSKFVLTLSRLSFCMFATHSMVIHFIFASLDVQSGSPVFLGIVYVSVMVLSTFIGFCMYIVVEAPFQTIVTNWMSGKRKTR